MCASAQLLLENVKAHSTVWRSEMSAKIHDTDVAKFLTNVANTPAVGKVPPRA